MEATRENHKNRAEMLTNAHEMLIALSILIGPYLLERPKNGQVLKMLKMLKKWAKMRNVQNAYISIVPIYIYYYISVYSCKSEHFEHLSICRKNRLNLHLNAVFRKFA
jgi:uncharacterized membrane protein (DUF106 family)